MFRCLILLTLACSFFGCHPRDLEDYRKAGEAAIAEIALELSKAQSFKELEGRKTFLKKRFRKLSKLMIDAAEYQRKYDPDERDKEAFHAASDRLYYELLRISTEIEGGKLFLEELQHEMLDRLDVDIRKHQKVKQSVN